MHYLTLSSTPIAFMNCIGEYVTKPIQSGTANKNTLKCKY